MTKIAIYSRKSKFTGKGESIENQIKKCKEFIKFKFDLDPEDSEIFIDEGFSGKNEDRPQYQLMINKIKRKEINSVVIYQLNRLGRNARDIHNTMQMCDDLGSVIYSATEGFDSSTSFGRALIGILASLAQLEREQLAERVKDNMYTLAKMGRWLGGQSPLGFNGVRDYYIDESGKERSITKLKENNDELKLVKAIYKKYLEEKSLSQVSKWSLTNNFKGKNGGNIDKSAINVILQNPVYVKSTPEVVNYLTNNEYEVCGDPNGNGILRYGKNKVKTKTENVVSENVTSNIIENTSIAAIAKHKGIIESSDWLNVQEILKINTEKAPSIGKSKVALLTGLLKCSCGSNMQMRYGPKRKDGTKSYYYVCNMKINSGGTRCTSTNINGQLLEEKLLNQLKSYNSEVLMKELENTLSQSKELETKIDIKSMNNDIDNANKEIKNLMSNLKQTENKAVAKRILSEVEEIENTISTLENKKEELLNDQSKLALTQNEIFNIVSYLNEFNTTYDDLSYDYKKKSINKLLESIIYDNNKLHLRFNIKKN
jgi:DNA invertase Pin-like site-specific DNA recombinase